LVDAEDIIAGGQRVFASTVLWSAGVLASPLGRWLGAATDESGRVIVNPDLSIPGHPEVFAIGDTAHVVAQSRNLLIIPATPIMSDVVTRSCSVLAANRLEKSRHVWQNFMCIWGTPLGNEYIHYSGSVATGERTGLWQRPRLTGVLRSCCHNFAGHTRALTARLLGSS
jgi:NADH dehydrogenase FAD-containing subunit